MASKKKSKKVKEAIPLEENVTFEGEIALIGNEQFIDSNPNYILGKDRISRNILTKYERAAIIGNRAAQIARGSIVSDDIKGNLKDPFEIAKQELRKKKTPMHILRKMPDGKIEVWSISELIDPSI